MFTSHRLPHQLSWSNLKNVCIWHFTSCRDRSQKVKVTNKLIILPIKYIRVNPNKIHRLAQQVWYRSHYFAQILEFMSHRDLKMRSWY